LGRQELEWGWLKYTSLCTSKLGYFRVGGVSTKKVNLKKKIPYFTEGCDYSAIPTNAGLSYCS